MISYHGSINGISRFFSFSFFFAMSLAESQFPNQGLNPGHVSEKPKTRTTRPPGNSPAFVLLQYLISKLLSNTRGPYSYVSSSLNLKQIQKAKMESIY